MKRDVMKTFVSFVPGCALAVVAGLSAFASASGPAAGDPRPYIYLEGGLPEGVAAAVQVMKEYQYGKLIGMSVTIRLFGKTAFLSLPGEASYQSPPVVPAEAPPAGASAAHSGMTVHDSGEISIGIEMILGDGSTRMMSFLCRWIDGKWQVFISAC